MNKPRYHIFLIALVSLLAYSNTFHASFHFDDKPNIVGNPIIKDYHYFLEPSKAQGLWVYYLFQNRYVGYLTFALNYHLHGLDVTGYHVVNLTIHIINALLVYWFVILSFRTPFLRSTQLSGREDLIALFSALLFVSHPIQTQAVTYIVQRFASLATLFYLLSLVTYIKWRLSQQRTGAEGQTADKGRITSQAKSALWYLSSVLCAILAMKTKEIAFTLPVVIALYEFFFFQGQVKKRLLALIPLFLTMLIIPLSMFSLDKPIGDLFGDVGEATRLKSSLSRWDYLFTQFRVIVTYLRLILFPIHQNLDYDYPVYHAFFNQEVALSFLLLAAFSALGLYLVSKSRKTPVLRLAAFGIFWFFITLSVESSIIPITDVIFEHRLYLPLAGFFIAAAIIAFSIVDIPRKTQWLRIAVICFAVIIVVLSALSYMRNQVWRDEIRLWENVVKNSPRKERGHGHLGDAYRDVGRANEAIEQYRIVLTLNPDNEEAQANMANAYLATGQIDKAIEHLLIAATMRPVREDVNKYQAGVRNNLGLAYVQKGLLDKAREQFTAALRINPSYEDAYYNLGCSYLYQEDLDAAERYFLKAVKINPADSDVHVKLGNIYLARGNIEQARTELETALRLNPRDQEAQRALQLLNATN